MPRQPIPLTTLCDAWIMRIEESQAEPTEWYAGVTSHVNARLFEVHNVPKDTGIYYVHEFQTEQEAREVEKRLLNWGCDGHEGDGDADSKSVYMYFKIAGVTDP